MKRCASEWPGRTRRPSMCWWSVTGNAPTVWPGPSCATPTTLAIFPRRRSCGSTRPPAASVVAPLLYLVLPDRRQPVPGPPPQASLVADDADVVERWQRASRSAARAPARSARRPCRSSWSGADHDRPVEAVEDLSPQQRAALVLQVQEELSTSEMGAVVGCSEGDGARPSAPRPGQSAEIRAG